MPIFCSYSSSESSLPASAAPMISVFYMVVHEHWAPLTVKINQNRVESHSNTAESNPVMFNKGRLVGNQNILVLLYMYC